MCVSAFSDQGRTVGYYLPWIKRELCFVTRHALIQRLDASAKCEELFNAGLYMDQPWLQLSVRVDEVRVGWWNASSRWRTAHVRSRTRASGARYAFTGHLAQGCVDAKSLR